MSGNTEGAQPVRLGRGVKVLEDRILVRRDKAADRTKGGIYLPDQAKDTPDEGRVVAVGPGKAYPLPSFDPELGQEPFFRIPMSCAVGDKVVFLKYGGTTIRHEGEELIALREADVIVILEDVAPQVADDDAPDDEGATPSGPGRPVGDFADLPEGEMLA